ncbi:hypothetical protein PV10_01155 [Exophiala mesophila]|uniref:Uncharacterized protein n=1 Tax=Exophiala mesophila TaxID=212818 RepID=A0A0D1X6E7_EXOME|nr:uncharacterized protein PV10_01155 [Exophiala mesophila]KIV97400.1 hypothetical protein PV10_01155 [Exophiala mesophila]
MAPVVGNPLKTSQSKPTSHPHRGDIAAREKSQSRSCRDVNVLPIQDPVSRHSYDFVTEGLMGSGNSHRQHQARTWPSDKEQTLDTAVRHPGYEDSLKSRRNGVAAWVTQDQRASKDDHRPLLDTATTLFGHSSHQGREATAREVKIPRGSADPFVGIGAQFQTDYPTRLRGDLDFI